MTTHSKRAIGRAIIFFILLIATFPPLGQPVQRGPDSSYFLVLNKLAGHSSWFGNPTLLTYGPMGYLYYPMPLENNVWVSAVFWVCTRLILTGLCVWAVFANRTKETLLKWIGLLTAFFLLNRLDGTLAMNLMTPVIIMLLSLILFSKNGRILFAFTAALYGAIAILSNATSTFFCTALVTGWILTTIHKNNRLAILAVLFGVSLSIFLLVFQLSPFNLIYLVKGYTAFSSGYSDAIQVVKNNHWFILLLGLLAWGLFIQSARSKSFAVPTGILLFVAFRYATGRQDISHEHVFPDLVLLIMLSWVISSKRISRHSITAGIISILFFAWSFAKVEANQDPAFFKYTFRSLFRRNGPGEFFRYTLDLDQTNQLLTAESKHNTLTSSLSESFLSKIGGKSVDFYPHEYSYLYANALTWHPRPIIESYAGFSPQLDLRNATYFRDNKQAPEFLIFHPAIKDDNPLSGIDGRYVPFDEPLTMQEILRWYEPISQEKELVLTKRRLAPKPLGITSQTAVDISSNPHITIPISTTRGATLLRILWSKSIPEKFAGFVYKEKPLFLSVIINKDSILYRVSPRNLESGLIISPFAQNWRDVFSYQGKVIKSIQLTNL